MCYIKDVGEVGPLPDTTGRRPFFRLSREIKAKTGAWAERQEAHALRSNTGEAPADQGGSYGKLKSDPNPPVERCRVDLLTL
jgi:hypothetical protein